VEAHSAGSTLADLGAHLRAVREEAGLTGTELAAALGAGWGQPKISKIETGRQLPTEAEVRAWTSATKTPPDRLLALRSRAAGGEQRVRLVDPDACTLVGVFAPVTVPELLQTPAYLRHATVAALPDGGITAETLGHAIAAVIRRQAMLYEPGREFVHVTTEAALRLRIGTMTVATLRGQLLHLAELATLPAHTFGVLPFETACPVPPVGFGLYDRTLLRVESSVGTLDSTEPDVVARFAQRLDRLVDAALVASAAVDFCRQVATSLPD
jgi:transcriptional regulator with XRE-family HTH domain